MPSQVRIIAGPRNVAFDHYIRDVLERNAWEQEHVYFGIEQEERANYVRQKLRTAGRHMDPPVAVRAFYERCGGCNNGGPSCRFHVKFFVYDMDKARAYKNAMDEAAGKKKRQ